MGLYGSQYDYVIHVALIATSHVSRFLDLIIHLTHANAQEINGEALHKVYQ